MKKYDIFTIGSATLDIFLQSKVFEVHPSPKSLTGLEQCFPFGAKIELQNLFFDTGGGATNTAFSFANFGMKTAPLCRIALDFAGQEVLKALKQKKIESKFIAFDQKEKTALSIILLAKTGERTILVYRGASKNFSEKDIPWDKLHSHWIYLSSLGGNLKLFRKILDVCEKRKIQLAWNPGGQEIKHGYQEFAKDLAKVSVLIMNREEALTFFQAKETSQKQLLKLLKILSQKTKKATAITLGKQGALAANQKEILFSPALGKKVVNTTGAGDAFSAGFIAGLWFWNNLDLALRLGILNSGLCVTQMGAKKGLLSSLPAKKELEKLPLKLIKKI